MYKRIIKIIFKTILCVVIIIFPRVGVAFMCIVGIVSFKFDK